MTATWALYAEPRKTQTDAIGVMFVSGLGKLSDIAKPTHQKMDKGLLVVNPPWGERISTPAAAANLYAALGQGNALRNLLDGMHQ
jgi:23S rRNA G2445 N2-methylase RlmL